MQHIPLKLQRAITNHMSQQPRRPAAQKRVQERFASKNCFRIVTYPVGKV